MTGTLPGVMSVRVQPSRLSRSRSGRAWVADVTLHLDGGGAVHIGNVRAYLPHAGAQLQIGMPIRPTRGGGFIPVIGLPEPWLNTLRDALVKAIAESVVSEGAEA